MIAKGRSDFQSMVDSSVSVLLGIIEDVSTPILQKINIIECERKINSEKITEWDEKNQKEVTTVWTPDIPTDIYYNTLYELYVSIVQRIYSFCENGLFELIMDKKQAKKARCNKQKEEETRNLTDLELYNIIIQRQYNISLVDICSIWTNFNQFHQLRKELTHSSFYPLFQHSQYLKKDFLVKNLYDIKALLLYTERQINY